MRRWFNGFVSFKGGKLKERFPDGIVCGEDNQYNEIVELNNCIKLISFDPYSILSAPLSQVDYFEVWK